MKKKITIKKQIRGIHVFVAVCADKDCCDSPVVDNTEMFAIFGDMKSAKKFIKGKKMKVLECHLINEI